MVFNDLTYREFKDYFRSMNYVFDERKNAINLIGIRSSLNATNLWDDTLIVCYTDDTNRPCLKHYRNFTTDPGYYFLKTNILNPKGCAILVEGQYRNMWTIGLHKGYKAFVQYGQTAVYRDNNKDNILDENVIDRGYFGIDLHHGFNSYVIFNNSAGCQVLKDPKDLTDLLVLGEAHERAYGKGINYTLLRNG